MYIVELVLFKWDSVTQEGRETLEIRLACCIPPFLLPSRDLAWHDLAFYNADLYEGLRRMLLDAQEGKKSKEEFMSTYCCYFEVLIHVSMRDEKEGRKKQARSNKQQGKATQHTQGSHFS